jgi:hypothetical protein
MKTISLLTNVAFLLLFPTMAIMAESTDSIVTSRPPISIQTTANYSYLYPKGGFNEEAIHSYGTGFYDLRIKWGESPTLQAGLLYGDYNHIHVKRAESECKSRIGNVIAAFFGMQYDIVKSGRWKLGAEVNHGIAYCTDPYNDTKNPDNRMIGSRFTFYIGIGAYVRYRLSPQWSVGMNIDTKHFSNGTVWQPNLGANSVGPSLTLQYDMEPQPLRYQKGSSAGKSFYYKKGYYIDITSGIGLKTIRPVFDDTRNKHQAVYGFPFVSAGIMKRYHKYNASGIALDYTYANYMDRIHEYEKTEGYTGYSYSRQMLGLSLKHEMFYRHLSASAAMGYYLYRKGGHYGKYDEGKLYQVIGIRYSFPFTKDRLYVGYQVKAHTFSKADCTNIYLGYRIGL